MPPPPLPLSPAPSLRLKRQSDMGTNTTQTLSGDCLIGELKRVIEKQKPKENLVPDEDIVFMLSKIPTILDNDDFETKKEIKEQEDKEINEIDLQRLRDKINSGHTPSELELYFGGPNRNFFLICSGSNLTEIIRILLTFCLPILVQKFLEKICFQFTLKPANIFYDNYNTGESIYDFLLRQQDDTKKNNSCNNDLHRFFLKLHQILFR